MVSTFERGEATPSQIRLVHPVILLPDVLVCGLVAMSAASARKTSSETLDRANYLDRANLNNAYVSGMKQDLNFKGKQLNVINTGKMKQAT